MRGSRSIDLQKYRCPDRYGPHLIHGLLYMQVCSVLASKLHNMSSWRSIVDPICYPSKLGPFPVHDSRGDSTRHSFATPSCFHGLLCHHSDEFLIGSTTSHCLAPTAWSIAFYIPVSVLARPRDRQPPPGAAAPNLSARIQPQVCL
jgi:hypothetical protein